MLQTVKDKEPVLTPEVVLETDFILPQQRCRIELGPDLIQEICLIETGESGLQILRPDQTVKFVVLPLPAVGLDDTEAHQDQIRAAVCGLQRIRERVGEQFVVGINKGDKGSVFTDQLQSGIARLGRPVVFRADITKPLIPVGEPAENGGRAVGGAVIHHNQLQILMGLAQHALY